jgi:hypothetical protein
MAAKRQILPAVWEAEGSSIRPMNIFHIAQHIPDSDVRLPLLAIRTMLNGFEHKLGVPRMNLIPVRRKYLDGAIHPTEVELHFGWLESHPCPFSGLDQIDPGGLHHLRIFLPHFLRPVIRVIISSIEKLAAVPFNKIYGLSLSIPPPPLARGLQAILRKSHTSLLCIPQVSQVSSALFCPPLVGFSINGPTFCPLTSPLQRTTAPARAGPIRARAS